MINRLHVEKILALNGLDTAAGDDAIRSVLVSAKWNQDDVETALTVLREDKDGHSHVETYKNIFNSDARLSPESIQSLLGIEVEMTSHQIATISSSKQNISFWQVMSIVIYATILAFSSIVLVMYIQNFGLFHPAA